MANPVCFFSLSFEETATHTEQNEEASLPSLQGGGLPVFDDRVMVSLSLSKGKVGPLSPFYRGVEDNPQPINPDGSGLGVRGLSVGEKGCYPPTHQPDYQGDGPNGGRVFIDPSSICPHSVP